MDGKIKIVSVVGPTASGKTSLSIEIAKQFNGEIISADSMQIYKEMEIATAKPSEEEKQGIEHHLMDFLPPDKEYSVADFVADASRCIAEISKRGRLPVVVGGTGLYVDSLLNNYGYNEEKRSKEISDKLWDVYYSDGIDVLLEKLSQVDYDSFERLKTEKNPKRVIRAIEFYKSTGMTITEQIINSRKNPSPYSAVKIGINFRDRQKLYERINQRVDLMLDKGLVKEAEKVLSGKLSITSVKAIGYKELAPYFNGESSLEECVEKLKRETRRYAKRQITWFKRDDEINWLYAEDYTDFEQMCSAAFRIIEKG